MGWKVFWMEPTPLVERALRRWESAGDGSHGEYGVHHPRVVLERVTKAPEPELTQRGAHVAWGGREALDPPTAQFHHAPWPTRCACGYEFSPDDGRSVDDHRLYSGSPDGELYTIRNAPIGAMWDAWWYAVLPHYRGPDGLCLVVSTPGGPWHVDGRCSNCTLPDDDAHKCWVRHGDPRTGDVHVDKNGYTCAAGAGSIVIGGYHGFLHHSMLSNHM